MPQTPESLILTSKQLQLSAWDNVRYLVSVLALQGEPTQVYEVTLEGKLHYLVNGLGVNFDCGRCNSYQTPIALLTVTDINPNRTLDIAPLSAEQINYLCMETAHFDHCY